MKNIPLVDLRAGFEPIKNEIMQAIESVFSDMHLYLGPNVIALEDEFSSYCGTQYAIGVGSGTEAIHLALLSCGIQAGDEVITSPNTFFATVEAIVHAGAKSIFVDIEPKTYTIDTSQIEKKINSRTKAIIPVHMYGQSAEMEPIMELSEKYGIKIIEDACQAHGAEYMLQNNPPESPHTPLWKRDNPPFPPLVKGGEGGLFIKGGFKGEYKGGKGGFVSKKCGGIGDAGCFSFYFTKNLGGYGEGGMVVTNNPEIAEKVKLYRNHGHKTKYEHPVIGYNSRLDEIQAAILRIKLKYLDTYNALRRQIAEKYHILLKDTPLELPGESQNRKHVYHLYVVRTKERDRLQEYLTGEGIGTGIHYKMPIHLQDACKQYGYKPNDFPEVEKACNEILSLPIYPEIKDDDIHYITDKINAFYAG
ncbi:MAG: DegT/DnrJ/EryC1/StrS family aminotransferase [Nitrospira sp.]|nr:DegT/DnrJ/EryC1/StrS family aminotransferase [Nitrospira sp.]